MPNLFMSYVLMLQENSRIDNIQVVIVLFKITHSLPYWYLLALYFSLSLLFLVL